MLCRVQFTDIEACIAGSNHIVRESQYHQLRTSQLQRLRNVMSKGEEFLGAEIARMPSESGEEVYHELFDFRVGTNVVFQIKERFVF